MYVFKKISKVFSCLMVFPDRFGPKAWIWNFLGVCGGGAAGFKLVFWIQKLKIRSISLVLHPKSAFQH